LLKKWKIKKRRNKMATKETDTKKKTTVKKPAVKKTTAKKTTAKKPVAKKETVKKPVASKAKSDKKAEKVDLKTVKTPAKQTNANKDTGSPEYQITSLTKRINLLTEHLKLNIHDHHSRHGLLLLVGKRRGLLDYLQNVEISRYRSIIKELHIRK
jgi:small subunit ribosomal protein S15